MSEHVMEVDDKGFDAEVLQAELPVLVDFWAPWCGPCRMLGPTVEKVASQLSGKLKVVKVNVDDSPETAGSYAIRSIPTLMWFKGGEKVDAAIGVLPEEALLSKCESVLS